MNKILGNYLAQQNNDFPLDCETLDYLQQNQHMAEMIGAIAGDKIILSGCDISGSTRRSGYVFLKTQDFPQGEVLFFEGGDKTHSTLFLEKSAIAVTANANPYPNAYTKRTLRAGLGSEQYNWSDFVTLTNKTNRQLRTEIEALQAQIATLQPAPAGSIMMWPSNTIPSGWALCNGSSYSRSEYAALFSVLGITYGADDNSTFKIPDMRGRFVAGKGANGYDELHQPRPGEEGANTVALTANESGLPAHSHPMVEAPNHTHKITYWDNGNGSNDTEFTNEWAVDGKSDAYPAGNTGGATKVKSVRLSASYGDTWVGNDYVQMKGAGAHKHTINNNTAANAAQAHENRPPFIVMNYIIKLK